MLKEDGDGPNKPMAIENSFDRRPSTDLHKIANPRNADLDGDANQLNKYSSLEDGEVRDDEEYEEQNGHTGGRDIKVKQRTSIFSDEEENGRRSLAVLDAEVDFSYGHSVTKNVYQTEEPNQFNDGNGRISTGGNLFYISHDTNNYESSVY